ncbi:MAG: hypothetical protein OXE49_08730 [Gemmatimonadetes bacterium]|nr:hypothetical protein [Gemmatimonadota bacterium]
MRGIFERAILLLFVTLASCGKDPVAPVVLEEGVVIASPADVTALREKGGAAYIIDGDLQIVGSSLVALTGLEGLRRVEGSVEIWFNDRLESLAGLEGLESVGAGLGPVDASSPLPTPAAGKAAHVVEGLLIFENKTLRSLKGLENLASVSGGLALVRNEALSSLTDMPQLVEIEGSVDIWFNDALQSLEGLHHLARVRDFLEVSGNDALQSLDGLRGISHVGADLIISNNALLPQAEVWAFAERMVSEGFAGAVIVQGNLDD